MSSDESAGPGDISAIPICISDESGTPVNPDQVLSDDDLPTAVRTEDRRQVIWIRDVLPDVQVVGLSQDDQICDTRAVWGAEQPPDIPDGDLQQPVCGVALPPEVRTSAIPPGVGAADSTLTDSTPVVRADDVPPVGRIETVQPAMPPYSVQMSPDSPQTVAFEDMAVSSVPMSPNCVRVENSQDVPDEGPVFDVSPDTSGFLMRLPGAAVQTPVAGFPFKQALNTFSDPVLGDPIAFAQCATVPESDTPMTLPVYSLPSGLALIPGQSSVQMAMASSVSSRLEGWSSGMPQTFDVSREGPFDVYSSPMDTGIALWSRRACRVVRIGLHLTLARRSQIHLGCSSPVSRVY